MKRALIVLALLAGCGQQPNNDKFAGKEFERLTVTVDLKLYHSVHALRQAAKAAKAKQRQGRDIFAWGLVWPVTPRCEIHTLDPEIKWSEADLGHEFGHCIWGNWHK